MSQRTLSRQVALQSYSWSELPGWLTELAEEARLARSRSYAPYSKFPVGSALRLNDGTLVGGANQENAAYPSGLCAERTALFFAGTQYPAKAVENLYICVKPDAAQMPFPCGACLQVMVETENRQGSEMTIWLEEPGGQRVWKAQGVKQFLPFAFVKEHLA